MSTEVAVFPDSIIARKLSLLTMKSAVAVTEGLLEVKRLGHVPGPSWILTDRHSWMTMKNMAQFYQRAHNCGVGRPLREAADVWHIGGS